MNFPIWYLGKGTKQLFEIFGNLLWFLWRFFAFARHTRTLLSPWHRDVKFRNWRGLHPVLWLKRLAENIFARVMGMIARLTVMAAGLAVVFVFLAAVLLILTVWFTFPLWVITGIVLFFGPWRLIGVFMLVSAVVFAFFVWRAFAAVSRQKDYRQMSLAQLLEQPFFERVLTRTGLRPEELTGEVLSDFDKFKKLLDKHNIDPTLFERVLEKEISFQEKKEAQGKWWRRENLRRARPIGQYWSYGWTVNLDRYGVDLSLADHSDYSQAELAGRREAFDLLLLTLQRPHDNNALLTGVPGVGKKTLVHYLARCLRRGDYDDNPFLRDQRIILLDLSEALADARYRTGDIDLFLHQIFHEAAYAGNIVLVIDNFHRYVKNDKTSYDITPVLVDYVHLPSFRLVTTTTRTAYRHILERRSDLLKNFSVIDVPEPDSESTVDILLEKFASVEKERVIFSLSALLDIVRLSERYHADAPLPKRALDLATEVFIYWRDLPSRPTLIDSAVVRDFVTLKTGMPLGAIDEAEREKLLNMEEILHRRIIGQEDAVRQVAEAVRIMRSGITDSGKPMSSFLFLGPTGVGKTETAKALADIYYGSTDSMIRIDMSEFQGPDAVSRLIGDASTGEPGRLTTAAKRQPYSLLLLDELEKANARALDIFLQILDEGFVTDAFGSRVSFRNMIIIATSNAGAVFLADELKKGTSHEELKRKIIDKIVHDGIYRMEFLNRFSDIILFRPLTEEELQKVVKLMLERLARRIKKEKNITLRVDEAVVPVIVKNGYSDVFGARSIARYIDDKISDVIARKIIAGDIVPGGEILIGPNDLDEY